MKKIISAALAVMFTVVFAAGCGKDARILYNGKLSEYVELGDYKNIQVDTSSDSFKEYYDDEVSADVSSYDLYVRRTEGTVAGGDTVNIDYVGKKDGEAFDGGTASGYYLTIGSNSFIDGFEEGLIGVEIGSTVDLDLTFPEDYSSAPELAGQPVVFTVTVNYVRTEEERKPEDYYSELGYASFDEYDSELSERAAKVYLTDKVIENSEIKGFPEEDTETIYSAYKNTVDKNVSSQYGIDFETYLSYNGQTEEQFKADAVTNQIEPLMKEQMVLYSVLDEEKLGLTDEEVQAELERQAESFNSTSVTAETLNEYYGEYFFEYLVVKEKAVDFLYENAEIS